MTNWFRLNETVNSLISWIGDKQEQLISSVNIKTINGVDILGSGNIDITKSDVGLPLAQNTAFNKNFGSTVGTVVEGGTLGSNAYSSTAYLPLSGGALTGTLTATSYTATSLPVFENNAAASSLAVGQFYRTSTGVLMVKF